MDWQQKQIAKFFDLIKKFSDYWNLLDIRYIIYKSDSSTGPSNNWHNILTVIQLLNGDEKKIIKMSGLPTIQNFIFGQYIFSGPGIEGKIQDILNGKCVLNQNEVYYSSDASNSSGGYKSISLHESVRNKEKQKSSTDMYNIRLTGTGGRIDSIIDAGRIDEIDSDLKARIQPIDGMNDIIHTYFCDKNIYDDWRYGPCEFIVFLAIPLLIDYQKVRIDEKAIGSEIKIGTGLNLNRIRLGCIPWPRKKLGGSMGQSIKKDQIINKKPNHSIAKVHFKRKGLHGCSLFLSYNGHLCDQGYFDGPPECWNKTIHRIHSALDPNFEHWRRLLTKIKPNKPDQQGISFERAVLWLFDFLGFHTHYLGSSGLREDIDIIAFSPWYDIIFPIECTVGDINNDGKLTKLIRRAGYVEKSFPKSYILPIIATQLNWETISTEHLIVAQDEEIAVMTYERLMGYMEYSHRPFNHLELYNEILDYIPRLPGKTPSPQKRNKIYR